MTWDYLPTMPTPRRNVGVIAAAGKIYVIGGNDEQGKYYATVESFNPTTYAWESCPKMNTARSSVGVATLNESIYVFGGEDSTQSRTDEFEIYATAKKSWYRVRNIEGIQENSN